MPTIRIVRRGNTARRAFSLVEMLVVLGIIILLLGILIPVVMRARRSSRAVACAANLHEIGQMLLMYAEANQDRLPLGVTAVANSDGSVTLNPTWTCYVVVDGLASANIGALVDAGMFKPDTEKILYCPSDPDEKMTWKLWRDKFPTPDHPLGPRLGFAIRISYFGRPVSRIWLHYYNPFPFNLGVAPPKTYVRLDDMQGKALFSEWIHGPAPHGSEGSPMVNALYYDGSVRGVICKPDDYGQLRLPPNDLSAGGVPNPPFLHPENNSLLDLSWQVLDTQ